MVEKETQRRLLGSKNQRIICLTERYKDCIDTWFNSSETKTREVSWADKIVINGDAVWFTGEIITNEVFSVWYWVLRR